jgi:F0F1-type ATP synthase epsilon subunit
MFLTITTPSRTVMTARPITGVFVKTDVGPLAILNNHASLITTSRAGTLRIVDDKETTTWNIRNATIQMDNATNHLTILALSCEPLGNLTQLNLDNYLSYLNKALSDDSLDKSSLKYKFLEGERISVTKTGR